MQEDIHGILKQYWGFSRFRPQQEAIIRSVLEGRDVLALLPTGGGKSVCFQVPSMAREGICLVVSPLIALMKDQVNNLNKKGITAFSIVSGMEQREVRKTLSLAMESNCKFLYVSPERLTTRLFKEYLPALPIQLIAVDEAHCISQWGYDFRPPYLEIAAIREALPDVPVIALTASATPEVQEDIMDKLQFQKGRSFQTSFARPNLSYSARFSNVKIQSLIHIFQRIEGTGIVYCKSRKRTVDISELLRQQQISADFYHAGLKAEERSAKQEEWIAGKTRVMVCTNAFGMGIDKPDVRIVVHYDVPDTLENYYQEAGRAGRDEQRAYAVLLYSEKDLEELNLQPDIKYPEPAAIHVAYRALVNFLQIPANTGEGMYFDFDYALFRERFQLPSSTTPHALKALEQDGWIQINEKTWKPSRLAFSCSRAYLREVQETRPAWNEVILALLRSYEGIFDFPVNIREKHLAYVCEIPVEQVIETLKILDRAGVVQYMPAPENPQIYFLKNRIAVEEFRFSEKAHVQRREKYRKRIEEMIRFTTDLSSCRAVQIGTYFGDRNIQPCGICDNCLARKKNSKTAITVQEQLLSMLKNGAMDIHTLMKVLQDKFGEEPVHAAIRKMEQELVIVLNEDGQVSLL